MALRILIVPDKFKGTLTAREAAAAIAAGWGKRRPQDLLELLPMTDGGDGFGEIVGGLLGARARTVRSVDAAHQPIKASWWWHSDSGTAIVEAARSNGLALLPPGKFHPFQLDTFGLGKVLRTVAKAKVANCLVGIGGSATNDGGFGMARALGWRFLDRHGIELREWWQLRTLARICRPATSLGICLTVAVDVRNPLLGRFGCSRIYGPQKGLREQDFAHAEDCLRQMAIVLRDQHGIDTAEIAGAGAAGGLGFGLMAFAGAKMESGFNIFARYAGLEKRIAAADLVITGEGALDRQTAMGKGVGQIARMARRRGVACIGLAGIADLPPMRGRLFSAVAQLTEITSLERAKKEAASCLKLLSAKMAGAWPVGSD